MINELKKELRKESSKKRAEESQRFFKTGPGEYGEGDKFLGIKVPVLRKLGKKSTNINLNSVKSLR